MAQTYNLTEGKVHKILLKFFFPMLFTNLLQQIYSFADTVIVGKGIGDNALASIGNMSPLIFLITGFSMGLTNGFSILIAQSYGSKNYSKLRKAIALSTKLSIIISLFLTIISLILLKSVLLAIQTSEVILKDSLNYGYIIFSGLVATMAYNLCSCILRALGDSRTPFIAISISSVLNIVLDIIFIFVVKTGVEGAAIATIFSQIVSSVICYMKLKNIDIVHINRSDFKNDFSLYFSLLKNSIPMACMNSITAIGCMIVQYYVNRLGVIYTSVYSACNKYINLFMLPSVTAGFSISSFTSQNYGAKKYIRIKEGVKVSLFIAIVTYVIIGLVMVIFPNSLAKVMLNSEQAIELASEFLRICGIMLFSLNFLFIYRNAVYGMGHPLIPMISGVLEMILRIFIIIMFISKAGFKATALAEVIAWTDAFLLNIVAYKVIINKK